MQDVSDPRGEVGGGQAETDADAVEADAPEAAEEAHGEVAPDGNDVSIDLRPDGETTDDAGDADLSETPAPDDTDAPAPADVTETADGGSPADVVPDTAPEVPSDWGMDGETVAPPLVRCAGRMGSGGIVGANGVRLRGTVGTGVRALRIGE